MSRECGVSTSFASCETTGFHNRMLGQHSFFMLLAGVAALAVVALLFVLLLVPAAGQLTGLASLVIGMALAVLISRALGL